MMKHIKQFLKQYEMFENGKTVDSITITDHLKKNKQLKNVDSYYLTGLIEDAPTSENVEYYSDIVKQKYTLRTIINALKDMSKEVMMRSMILLKF